MSNIKIITIGGQNENGKNCILLETHESIYIFNFGIKIPINSNLGISYIHADYEYLYQNRKKIKGIFIGTSTFLNIGGISYLLKKIGTDIPIYTHILGETTISTYFERKFKTNVDNLNINICENLRPIVFNDLNIVPISVSNYLPGSLSWVIKTEIGNIVLLEDFIVNNDKIPGFQSYLHQIITVTKHDILLLLISVGNVGKNEGYTTPFYKNESFYKTIIQNATGRVFISLNDYNGYTIYTLANIAKSLSKPFIIYSTTFMNVFSSMIKNRFFNHKGLISLPISQINESNNAIIVLIEPDDVIYKKTISVFSNQFNNITIKNDDTFILGTTLVPGYEMEAAQLMDQINRLDLKNYIIPKTILNLKASNEDHKYIIDLLKPKYIAPIEGLYMDMYKYYDLMSKYIPNKENIFLLLNGDALNIKPNNTIEIIHKYINTLNDIYISNNGNVDTHVSIINERKQLSCSGIIFLTLYYSKSENMFLNKIDINPYGIGSEANNSLYNDIIEKFKASINKYLEYDDNKKINIKESKVLLKKGLLRLFERKTIKKPIILPTIIEVN